MHLSKRIGRTSAPIVVALANLVKQSGRTDVLSLAQGVVHWSPPETALKRVESVLRAASTSKYGQDEGLLELRTLLAGKLVPDTANHGKHLMITQGANQALFSTLITVTDPKDSVGLLVPYYFNHHMALTALDLRVHLIERDDDLHADPGKIELAIARGKLKALVLTNPCNPTGTAIPLAALQAIQKACQKQRCTLIVDNTYRDFMFPPHKHGLVFGPNVFNVFSLSKNFGLAGWRIGYVDCPSAQAFEAMLKVQDTVVICPTQVSQHAALGALEADEDWLQSRVASLPENLQAVRQALVDSRAVTKVCGGEGSIFVFAKLGGFQPTSKGKARDDEEGGEEELVDDYFVVQQLVERFGVAVLPGAACGMDGWVRVSFANLPKDTCLEASKRLRLGLATLRDEAWEEAAAADKPRRK
ncbi:hypothetical protein BASA82_000009 [Batrachochytrium salamandrivorans]|nr:hypothetical protein BASA82_000009 [Batrachochytrium salamandrivorans]